MSDAGIPTSLEDGAVVDAAALPLLPESPHYNNLAASFPYGRPSFRFPALKYGCEKGLAGLPPNRIYYQTAYYVWVAASSIDSSAASCGVELPVFVRALLNLKLLAVAASQVAIIGSSNINDRSLLGMHDSEVNVVIQEPMGSKQTVQQLRVAGRIPRRPSRALVARGPAANVCKARGLQGNGLAFYHDTGRSGNCQRLRAGFE